jgi:hypothetical protein
MTLNTPPSWLQAGSYPAQYDRIIQQALYATTGIIGSSFISGYSANSTCGYVSARCRWLGRGCWNYNNRYGCLHILQ